MSIRHESVTVSRCPNGVAVDMACSEVIIDQQHRQLLSKAFPVKGIPT